jgi:hypothetical protein
MLFLVYEGGKVDILSGGELIENVKEVEVNLNCKIIRKLSQLLETSNDYTTQTIHVSPSRKTPLHPLQFQVNIQIFTLDFSPFQNFPLPFFPFPPLHHFRPFPCRCFSPTSSDISTQKASSNTIEINMEKFSFRTTLCCIMLLAVGVDGIAKGPSQPRVQ